MCVQLLYLHASRAQYAPPIPVQAKDKGIGQAVEWCWQDMQQGKREGWILRVEGIMEPIGEQRENKEKCWVHP